MIERTAHTKEERDFRKEFHDHFKPLLLNKEYKLVYEYTNDENANIKDCVFRMVFDGPKRIELKNTDWRDYTEYIHLVIDGKEVLHLDVTQFESPQLIFKIFNLLIEEF